MSKVSQSKDKITSSSSSEEVSKFFTKKYNITKEVQENIIKQEITGDILLSLEDADFKSLGLKLGPMKKIKKYLSDNPNDFPEIKIEVKIDVNSTKDDVKDFLDKYIGINEDLDLNGKELLELTNKDIKSIGLNLGKQKKLEKYLKYFNSIKSENKEEKKEEKKEKKKEIEKKDGQEQVQKDKKENEDKAKDGRDNNENPKEEEKKEKENEAEIEVIDEKQLPEKNIKPIDLKSKYNIFFMLSLTDNYNDKNFSIITCNGKKGDKYIEYPYNIISDEETTALDEEKRRILLIQVPSDKKLKELKVKILKKEIIQIKHEISSDNKKEKKEEEDKNEIIMDNEEKKEEKKEEDKKEETEEAKEEDKKEKEEEEVQDKKELEENKNEDKKEEDKDHKEIESEEKSKDEKREDKKEKVKKEIKVEIKEEIKVTEFICNIINNNEIDDYFHFFNLVFENLVDHIIFEENINFILEKYISFFLNEIIIPQKNYKKDLIQSLLYFLSSITKEKEILFTCNNLFYIFN